LDSRLYDTSEWTTEHYKKALKMTKSHPKREQKRLEAIIDERINALPIDSLKKFFASLQNKEFHLLPYRVYSRSDNDIENQLLSLNDIRHHSFTLFNKHAFATMFAFEMKDTQIQPTPFIQVSIERMYSSKVGSGSKLVHHLLRKAEQKNVTLTLWTENERLKEYFSDKGFKYKYKSLTTGHYFLMTDQV
jgi:hypothetical protein